jgi:hypothetical protein
VVVCNVQFPGQYYNAESGLNRPGFSGASLVRIVPSSIGANRPDTRVVWSMASTDNHRDEKPILRKHSMR